MNPSPPAISTPISPSMAIIERSRGFPSSGDPPFTCPPSSQTTEAFSSGIHCHSSFFAIHWSSTFLHPPRLRAFLPSTGCSTYPSMPGEARRFPISFKRRHRALSINRSPTTKPERRSSTPSTRAIEDARGFPTSSIELVTPSTHPILLQFHSSTEALLIMSSSSRSSPIQIDLSLGLFKLKL